MATLSENIKKSKELRNLYNKDCAELIKSINWLETITPGIFYTKNLNGSHSFTIWNEDNFYLFDEIKGFNLTMIRLLKAYLRLRVKLDNDIEVCIKNFRKSLRGYDEEVLEYEPMSEYARERFEQDRYGILRPFNELKGLKEEINSDKMTISIIDNEIKNREELAKEYLKFTYKDLIRKQKEVEDLLNSFEI